MIKGLIFDFDGLLVDTEAIWYEIYRDWFRNEHTYDLSISEFYVCVGSTDDLMFEIIGEKLGYSISVLDFEDFGKPIFIERTQSMDLLPGVKELIVEASRKGLKIALATSSVLERPTRILKEHNILHLFDVMVTREDVQNTKPDPEVFNTTAQRMGLNSEELLIFEDSLNGLIAGNEAGIKVVVVPNIITQDIEFSDYHIKIDSMLDFTLSDY